MNVRTQRHEGRPDQRIMAAMMRLEVRSGEMAGYVRIDDAAWVAQDFRDQAVKEGERRMAQLMEGDAYIYGEAETLRRVAGLTTDGMARGDATPHCVCGHPLAWHSGANSAAVMHGRLCECSHYLATPDKLGVDE